MDYSANPLRPTSPAARVLAVLTPGTRLGRIELIERSGIANELWTRAIRELLDRGLVTREGDRRGTCYVRTSA